MRSSKDMPLPLVLAASMIIAVGCNDSSLTKQLALDPEGITAISPGLSAATPGVVEAIFRPRSRRDRSAVRTAIPSGSNADLMDFPRVSAIASTRG